MPERLECEVLQKARYINKLTFTFYISVYKKKRLWQVGIVRHQCNLGTLGFMLNDACVVVDDLILRFLNS